MRKYFIFAKVSGASGAELWTHDAATTASAYANALAVDGDGNVLIGGHENTVDDASNFVVAKLASATGAEIWRTTLDEPDGNNPSDLAVDPSGDLVALGILHSIRFGGHDDAVLKFSGATGAELWRLVMPGSTGAAWESVRTDPAGDVAVLAGYGSDPRIIKVSGSTGTVLWSHSLGSSTGWNGIAVDGNGDIVATGFTSDTSQRVAVVKLAGTDGQEIWRTTADGAVAGVQVAGPVTVTARGDVVTAGETTNGPRGTDLTVFRFDGASGAETWRFTTHGTSDGDDAAADVSVDGAGDVFVVGSIANLSGIEEVFPDYPPTSGPPPFTLFKLDGATGAERWRRLRPVTGYGIALSAQTDPIVAGSGLVRLRGADGEDACGTGVCGVCEACDATGSCSAGARPGCTNLDSSRASLFMRTSPTHAKDRLRWKAGNRSISTLADFGDPRASGAPVTLCVFDEPSGTDHLVHTASIPTGSLCGALPCWQQSGSRKFSYRDHALSNDGIASVVDRAGRSGGTAITLSGQGPNLGLPASFGLVAPVLTQYQLQTGQCWQTVHAATAIKENGPDRFRAFGP